MPKLLNGIEEASDTDLWQQTVQGDGAAFEMLVSRHQQAVCAVAFSTCGDRTLSEDVGQETFWAAWKGRETLQDPSRLRAWLCGIARNLARNKCRHSDPPIASLDSLPEHSSRAADPAESAMLREEEALVWQSLQAIPESYREPLILFYREGQSIAEVAAALDLNIDTVKQRLSRGRGMLRDRMTERVESALRRSGPGQPFKLAVMAGIAGASVGSQTALAGTALGALATTAPAAAKSLGWSAIMGGLLGPIAGLAGGWLGVWLPAQLAPSQKERLYLEKSSYRLLWGSIGFILALLMGIFINWQSIRRWTPREQVFLFSLWLAGLLGYLVFESIRNMIAVKRFRQETEWEPNSSRLRTQALGLAARYEGRVYQSRIRLLGWPLLDINASDPGPGEQRSEARTPRKARGWVAIGDDAVGIVLAIGSIARGFIAIGGVALGGISIGGVAIGLVALGGLALGGLALGGLGIGLIGLGGFAIGRHAAGGGAWILHPGEPSTPMDTWLQSATLWCGTHPAWLVIGIVGLNLLLPLLMFSLTLRKKRPTSPVQIP